MGKLEYFTIVLQKPESQAVYFPGESLAGILMFRVLERFKINAVRMLVDGSGRVKWSEGTGKNRRTYASHEKYLEHKMVFMEKSSQQLQGNADLYLEPGEYSFPFNLVLPINLPTSFEHHYGRVRYMLNGTIDIPWAIDKHATRVFSVLNHIDLNFYPHLRSPAAITDSKTLCCGPCKSQPITGELTCLKTGFVPGETILCHATINNPTKREINPMKVTLVQIIDFHGDGFTHHIKRVKQDVVSIVSANFIQPRSFDNWDSTRLIIPPVCASTVDSVSRIIAVSYELVLNFDAVGFHVSKDLRIPIVIGTVPLLDQAHASRLSSYEATDSATTAAAAAASLLPPPYSFQASVFGPASDDDLPPDYDDIVGEVCDSNAKSFTPYYPYFDGLSSSNS